MPAHPKPEPRPKKARKSIDYAAYYAKNREKLLARAREWNRLHRNTGKRTGRPRLAKDVRRRGGPAKKHLDRIFSLIVRSLGACVRCGATERLQCAHIVSRRYLGVRFSLDNALCLCAGCHMYFTYRPLEWEKYIAERMGADAFADLKRRALDFRGPLDRVTVAADLYVEADRVGVHFNSRAGGTVAGLRRVRRRFQPPSRSASASLRKGTE